MNHFYLMSLKEKERNLLKRKAKECRQILKGMVSLCAHCNGFFLSLCGYFLVENISVFQLRGKSHGTEQREESFVGFFKSGVGTVLLTGTNKIMRWVRTPRWLWWRAILFMTVPFPAKPQGAVEWQACVFPAPTHLFLGGEEQCQSARLWTEVTAGILVLTRCTALNCWLTVWFVLRILLPGQHLI